MLKLLVLSGLVAAATTDTFVPGAYGNNYRGPLCLAPGQPANTLAADGRPLDTQDVNQDNSADYATMAQEQQYIHFLGKRSAPLFAPLGHVVTSPLLHSSPFVYSAAVLDSHLAVAPIAYSGAPIARYW